MEGKRAAMIDLDAYFSRIDHAGDCHSNHEVLEALHLAHATHIPFENLDILLGRRVSLDLESVQNKLILRRRGGYCFEQNRLFSAVLEQLGFNVTQLLARVHWDTAQILPRTHMVLKVDMEEESSWLADVGFGCQGLMKPLLFVSGQVTNQYLWTYRLVEDEGLWHLQSLQGDLWRDLYAFTQERQFPVDFEMANHYVSTHPSSRFVQTLTVQRPTPTARYMMHNNELTAICGSSRDIQIIPDEDVVGVLRDLFGLDFPVGTQFKSQAGRLEECLGET